MMTLLLEVIRDNLLKRIFRLWQRKRWRGAINYGLTAFYSIMANCSNKPEVTRCLQSLQANEMIMAHNRFQDQCKWDTRQSLLTRFNV